MMTRVLSMTMIVAALSLGGCGKKGDEASAKPATTTTPAPNPHSTPRLDDQLGKPAPVDHDPYAARPGDDADMARARRIFGLQCAMCHGAEGRGDGPASASLNPRPRDYSSKEWQASVTDDRIRLVIVQGGGGANLSVIMPPSPHLAQDQELLDGMVKLIRSFGAE